MEAVLLMSGGKTASPLCAMAVYLYSCHVLTGQNAQCSIFYKYHKRANPAHVYAYMKFLRKKITSK